MNTNITCYEKNTCTKYNEINHSLTDDIKIFNDDLNNINYKYNKTIDICTKDQINEVLNTMKKEEEYMKLKIKITVLTNNTHNLSSSVITIIISVTIIILISISVILWKYYKRYNNNKRIKALHKINENEIQWKDLSVNENSSTNENKISNLENIYSDNQHLPSYIESNDIFNYVSNSDSEYLIQHDEKKDNMINIVNAEVVNSEPSNYHDIIRQLTNNIDNINNNIKHHSLPSYVEIINDNGNNNSNQNIDIKKENDNNNEKTLSTSEPQQININTTEEIDIYMEENSKNVVNEAKPSYN
ncbi:hypothetical protein PIROE2DRAFT_10318 [Piromyces sp. E2]|nr:hypothetical protein PIROE2DRAFT_10318 [Piromyces sp. E2]|eukprot:OUM63163.1 hypothetical protein PIROE2DRAFT_10318 [Piromyces sp. E2]